MIDERNCGAVETTDSGSHRPLHSKVERFLVNSIRASALALVVSIGFMNVVNAASNAAGSIFGRADTGTVIIENVDTGLTREIPVENGRFNASALPVGTYNVTLVQNGDAITTREGVFVRIGSGSEVSFAEDTTKLAAITVTGAAVSPIDMSSTDTRVVFTAEQLEKIPVGRSIEDIALLTPGVVEADSRYPGTASFGGSAASENAFYINGYAVTNPLTNLGSTTLPFDAISQFQAITGGYGAEFGRATGGVINIITKSGTNQFRAGGRLIFEPNSTRGEERDRYFPNNDTDLDGLLYQERSEREVDSMTYAAYLSGPIIKDKLFFYTGYEVENQDVAGFDEFPGGPVGAYDIEYEIPRWIVKLDWNITNDHLLDFTAISDVTEETDSFYTYNYTGENAFVRGDTKNGGFYYEDGGELYIAKYTGYLTSNLTLSALYGTQRQEHIAEPFGYDPTVTYVTDDRDIADPVFAGSYLYIPFADAYDETESYRIDVEWRVSDHTFRLGYDRQDSESKTGRVTSGPTAVIADFGPTGSAWIYDRVSPENESDTYIDSTGNALLPKDPEGDYVYRYIYANGGTFQVEQDAFYVEDHWQLTPTWLLRLGIRNERFTNFNADGIPYAKQDNQWAPRIGATWDVFGDSSFKVFGQVGRYHLAMPMNVAARAASGSYYTREFFEYDGIDPETGIPQGLTPLREDGPFSLNNEFGQAKNPATVATADLESHYQDELVIGFEKLLNDWNVGARWVYRDLKSAIDDMCDGRPVQRYALANGYSQEDANAFANLGCRIFNPGEDNTFRLEDASGNVVTLPITAEALGFPELKRNYNGIDIFFEYPFDGTLYYKIDYTWSQNYGNAEGQLKSDIGQTDVSVTQDWDTPELMEYSNGYLPNDRRHYVKAFGYYQLNPEWRFSGTFTAHSGRPKNCIGYYANPNADPEFGPYDYGDAFFYCDGKPTPRGSEGRLPWAMRLDLGVNYAPNIFDNELQFGLDVFNVTDRQTVQNIEEIGESGPGAVAANYGIPISYSDPRVVRLTVQYDF